MEHRNGICEACGAHYKIPISFEHEEARCRECDGTVKIGPAVREEAAPEKAAESSEPLEQHVPSGKQRSGPSMKEKLLARRAEAEAAQSQPQSLPQPKPKPKPIAKATAATGPASPPAPERKARVEKKTSRKKASHEKTKGRSRGERPARMGSDADESEAESKPSPGDKRRGTSGRRSSSRGSGGGSSQKGSSQKGSSRKGSNRKGSNRKGASQKKKAPMGMLLGLGGLVVLLGAGGYFYWNDLAGSADALDSTPALAAILDDEAAAEDNTANTGQGDGSDGENAEGAPEMGDAESSKLAKNSMDASTNSTGGNQPAATKAAASKPGKASTGKYDPANIDLDAIADFGPVDGTDEEFWAELEARMIRAMNPDLGRGQTKEWDFLKKHPRKAFPVILNYLKHLDLSTKEATDQGKWAVRILEDICNGANYGWKEYKEDAEKAGETYFEWHNKGVVRAWTKAWSQVENNLNGWKNLAKLSDAELEKLKRSLGDSAPEPSSLDLLNDD